MEATNKKLLKNLHSASLPPQSLGVFAFRKLMKYLKRLSVVPFIFGILLVTHLIFVFKRTFKFIKGGGELILNEEKNV